MALFDLPLFLLSSADSRLAVLLPDVARVAVWGGLGAAASMALYWLISPQHRLACIAAEERRLKQSLRDGDLPMADGLAVARRLLHLALLRLGLVLPPVLIAALPVLLLIIWLEIYYAHELPPPERAATVQPFPKTAQGRWVAGGETAPHIEIVNEEGVVLQSRPIPVAVPVIQKRAWWNMLVGNPLGYLPDESPIERIDIDLPARHVLSIGPAWIRSWAAPFFAALLAVSLLFKLAFRIR